LCLEDGVAAGKLIFRCPELGPWQYITWGPCLNYSHRSHPLPPYSTTDKTVVIAFLSIFGTLCAIDNKPASLLYFFLEDGRPPHCAGTDEESKVIRIEMIRQSWMMTKKVARILGC